MSWYRSHYLNIGISGFLSATLVVLMLAYARMGTRMGEKNPGVAYRAETPERYPLSHASRATAICPANAGAFDRFRLATALQPAQASQ